MAFHTHDGWEFERTPDGGVVITHPGDDGPGPSSALVRHELTAEAWASVVASMSAGDEGSGRFYTALSFHSGVDLDPHTGAKP
jgi:hypothetical protein